MVWLNLSPIPVERRGIFSSFKSFLLAFPLVEEGRGRGVGTLWNDSGVLLNRDSKSTTHRPRFLGWSKGLASAMAPGLGPCKKVLGFIISPVSLTLFSSPETVSSLTVTHCKDTIPKFETNILRKGIARPQSQFPHSCVCERFIYSHDQSAYSAAGKYVD
jgi:hypothetical protein